MVADLLMKSSTRRMRRPFTAESRAHDRVGWRTCRSRSSQKMSERGLRWPAPWVSVIIGVLIAGMTYSMSDWLPPTYFVGLGFVVGACHRFNHMLVNELIAVVREPRSRGSSLLNDPDPDRSDHDVYLAMMAPLPAIESDEHVR